MKIHFKVIVEFKKRIKTQFIIYLLSILLVSSCSSALPVNNEIPGTNETGFNGPTQTLDSSRNSENSLVKIGYENNGPNYSIYFTDPQNPAAYTEENGLDKLLVNAINKSRISIDVAAYSLSLYSVQQALINAKHRGVVVRIVMESDNMNDRVPAALQAAGISIIGDHRDGLMHNKFIIIDRSEVWSGSMNFTNTGTYEDNNNLVRINSAKAADDFTVEFEEMFKDDFFGQDVISRTPYPEIDFSNSKIEILFSPDDHAAKKIISLLRSAQKSIYFLAYSFTANDFGDVIRQKEKDGLKIEGVMDEGQIQTNKGTEFTSFLKAGLPVYPDGNPGLMHHKVIIIDEKIVITGSYNFTSSAERSNDENVIIFYDEKAASDYVKEFQRIFDQSKKIPVKQ
ncbi:MAG: phospholipase D-like domain-containing protein [Chloroflexota bacterium]